MKLIDLNILLYAVNEDSAHHDVIRVWWDEALNGDEPVGLPWIVLLGFIRIATNPLIFPNPLKPDTAITKVDGWLSHQNTRLLQERDGHWNILPRLMAEAVPGPTVSRTLTSRGWQSVMESSCRIAIMTSDVFGGCGCENPLIQEA